MDSLQILVVCLCELLASPNVEIDYINGLNYTNFMYLGSLITLIVRLGF